jgi:hypothetical protein
VFGTGRGTSSSRAAETAGNSLADLITCFLRRTVLVLGDLMLDRYVAGEVSRISPEAGSRCFASPVRTRCWVVPPMLPTTSLLWALEPFSSALSVRTTRGTRSSFLQTAGVDIDARLSQHPRRSHQLLRVDQEDRESNRR